MLAIFLGIGLWGLHMGLTQGVLAALIAATAPERLRGTAFGLFGLVTGLAALIASVLAGLLWDRIGAPATFLAGAAFAAVAFIAFLLVKRDPSGVLEVQDPLALYRGSKARSRCRLRDPLPQDERARQRLRRARRAARARLRSGLTRCAPSPTATTGIGCDQLIALEPSRKADVFMRIWNADGGEVGACGNAARCVAALVAAERDAADVSIETESGVLGATVNGDGSVTVDMGAPRFAWDEIPLAEPFHDTRRIELQIGPIDAPVLHSPSVVNVGNPHCLFFVDDVEAYDLARFGPMLEHHPLFPERANISLAQVLGADALQGPHLGARRRADAGLRHGGLRRGGRGGAPRARPAARSR